MEYIKKKAYKYRIYPNKAQQEYLAQAFGSARFVYNQLLTIKYNTYQETKKILSKYELQNMLPKLKTENVFLKVTDSQSLQDSVYRLHKAFKDFYSKQNIAKRKIKNAKRMKLGYKAIIKPEYRSRKKKQSITIPVTSNNVRVDKENHTIKIPKLLSEVKMKYHREHKGKIKQITISKTVTNKYYVSLSCEYIIDKPIQKPITDKTTIGIDVGLTHFATLSTGEKIPNGRNIKKVQHLIKKRNRQLKRKQLGSKNRERTRLKLAKTYEKLSNRRNDFLQKTSTSITKKYDTICIEDLSVNTMLKNHRLAKYISDVSWSKFVNLLEYKCEWFGKNLIKVDRYFPSSKSCNNCDYIFKELKLSNRVWVCPNCGTKHDRDINASINLKNYGLIQSIGTEQPKSKHVENALSGSQYLLLENR